MSLLIELNSSSWIELHARRADVNQKISTIIVGGDIDDKTAALYEKSTEMLQVVNDTIRHIHDKPLNRLEVELFFSLADGIVSEIPSNYVQCVAVDKIAEEILTVKTRGLISEEINGIQEKITKLKLELEKKLDLSEKAALGEREVTPESPSLMKQMTEMATTFFLRSIYPNAANRD